MFKDLKQFIIRPIQKKDVSDLYGLAELTGIGLTSLPYDKKYLKMKIEYAIKSVEDDVGENPKKYLFVLEDIKNKKVIGTTGVKTGQGEAPFYSFKVSTMCHQSEQLEKNIEHKVLHLANDFQNAALLGSLFLHPDYRSHGLGPLLSRVRFLFIAMHLKEFSDTIIAELRGHFDEKNRCPFWEYVSKLFFEIPFEEADYLSAIASKQFIQDLLPRYPIYLTLLPKIVQNAVGKVHKETKPAQKILKAEGFAYQDYIDIFDGGPTLEAKKENIKTIKHAKEYILSNITDNLVSEKRYMMGVNVPDFIATASFVDIEGKNISISPEVAQQLSVAVGDSIWIAE